MPNISSIVLIILDWILDHFKIKPKTKTAFLSLIKSIFEEYLDGDVKSIIHAKLLITMFPNLPIPPASTTKKPTAKPNPSHVPP